MQSIKNIRGKDYYRFLFFCEFALRSYLKALKNGIDKKQAISEAIGETEKRANGFWKKESFELMFKDKELRKEIFTELKVVKKIIKAHRDFRKLLGGSDYVIDRWRYFEDLII